MAAQVTDRIDLLEQAVRVHGVQIAAMHRILVRVLVEVGKTNPELVQKTMRDYQGALAKHGASMSGPSGDSCES